MSKKRQTGSKSQRQNQHMRKLMMKIDKFKKRELNVDGLEKELSYCVGETERPSFKTGRAADLRFRNFRGDVKSA
jgi:hypothetical protein